MLLAPSASAQVPESINYQGRLLSGSNLVQGSQVMEFRLFTTPTGPAELYAETQNVLVVDGLYSVALGTSNPVSGSLSAALLTEGVWLEVKVGATALGPRERLRSVGYALKAAGVTNGAISSAMIANGAVTSVNLASNSVGSSAVTDGSIGVADLNTANVDARYVNATGDTINGNLNLNGLLDATPFGGNKLTFYFENFGDLPSFTTYHGMFAHVHTQGRAYYANGLQWVPLAHEDHDHDATYVNEAQGDSITSAMIVNGAIAAADVAANTFWETDGNAGITAGTHFLGTTDNRPLEFRVNGARAFRLEPTAVPNVVGGGADNDVQSGALGVFIGGGRDNTVRDDLVVIGGGTNNLTEAYASAIGGGEGNSILEFSWWATIGGGLHNRIAVSGGAATIAGGEGNHVGTNADFATIGGGQSNNVADFIFRATISGGTLNHVESSGATIGGGAQNVIGGNSDSSSIAGGLLNTIGDAARECAIGGGREGFIGANSPHGTISGGERNTIGDDAPNTTIGGGEGNSIGDISQFATIGGGISNVVGTFAFRATIGGGSRNSIGDAAEFATIGGGDDNNIRSNATHGVIGGGQSNVIRIGSTHNLIGGGRDNAVDSNSTLCVIGGGSRNRIRHSTARAGIGGGSANEIEEGADHSVIGGGSSNRISAGSMYATISGGRDNVVAGNHSFAAGRRAQANHNGTFVWADFTDEDFGSTGTRQFLIRAANGVGINTNDPQGSFYVNGSTDTNLSPLIVNRRQIGGGTLVDFRVEDGSVGSISVAGGVVSYNAFTASHYGWTDESLDAGTLVALTGRNRHVGGNPEAEIIYGVAACTTRNHPALLGTYLGTHDTGREERVNLIAAAGNGDVWVVDTGRDISPGDYLISSEIPGHAMMDDRADAVSHVIGRAGEVVTWADVSDRSEGVKHAKISILFDAFVRDNAAAPERVTRLEARVEQLESLLQQLAAWEHRQIARAD